MERLIEGRDTSCARAGERAVRDVHQVVGGLPAAVDACVRPGDIDAARVQQREVNPLTECAEASLVPYDQDEGSFFKVYLADTGLMFYKLAVNPRLWLESQEAAPVSSDFRGALAENSVMQALASNDLQTYYWVPPASWGGRGELDFLLQDDQARVIPVEVKSARNVRARTLSMFVERARAPYAVIFSEHDFGVERGERGEEIHMLPLYAAHCLGEGLVRTDA